MIEKEIQAFGASLGIKGLKLIAGKAFRLDIEKMGSLFFERIEDSLLIYLLKPYDFAPIAIPKEALALCYNQDAYPYLIHPVYHEKKGLGFLIKQSESECSLTSINRCIQLLRRLHDHLGAIKFS